MCVCGQVVCEQVLCGQVVCVSKCGQVVSVCGQVVCEQVLCGQVVCEEVVCVCVVEEEGGGRRAGEGGSAEPKTRTTHKDVGKKMFSRSTLDHPQA